MVDETIFPEPPDITEEDLRKCREAGDYCPVLFEWYKYVGMITNFYASIQQDSPALRSIPSIHYYILVGLLNRCARLILSNVALSHNGLFGETTSIIDRCIVESAIKIRWLCHNNKDEYFGRFLSEGLKTELEFKKNISSNINDRGHQIVIERRMLKSIDNYINSSGLCESDILGSKKLPDMAAMLNSIGYDRLMYIVIQRMGSHHIHGTWPSLRLHYLKDKNGTLSPRDHDCETHVNQYVLVPLMVLKAIRTFIEFICPDEADRVAFKKVPKAIEGEILKINKEVVGSDFEDINKI